MAKKGKAPVRKPAKKARAKTKAARKPARSNAPLTDEAADKLRRVVHPFALGMPHALLATGVWDVKEARKADPALRYEPDVDGVPEGRYRIGGSDFIVTIAGDDVAMVEKARPDADPAGYTTVPPAPNA
jgi:hypothetical protein